MAGGKLKMEYVLIVYVFIGLVLAVYKLNYHLISDNAPIKKQPMDTLIKILFFLCVIPIWPIFVKGLYDNRRKS